MQRPSSHHHQQHLSSSSSPSTSICLDPHHHGAFCSLELHRVCFGVQSRILSRALVPRVHCTQAHREPQTEQSTCPSCRASRQEEAWAMFAPDHPCHWQESRVPEGSANCASSHPHGTVDEVHTQELRFEFNPPASVQNCSPGHHVTKASEA